MTAQREMAALEKVGRMPLMDTLARPSTVLQGQGRVVHRIWPNQVRATERH